MRQAGMLAAAALYALEHHIERLADDHANAQRLADAVREIRGLEAGRRRGRHEHRDLRRRAVAGHGGRVLPAAERARAC